MTNSRPLVYVAGPITNDPWACVRRAIEVSELLRPFGIDCYLPQLSVLHEMIAPRSHETWMNLAKNILPRCDGLYRINVTRLQDLDPVPSSGADTEEQFAHQLEIPVYQSNRFGNESQTDRDYRLRGWITHVKTQAVKR